MLYGIKQMRERQQRKIFFSTHPIHPLIFALKEKFNFPKSILNITDSEKEIYEQAYSKKLRERKISIAAVIIGCMILVAVAAALIAENYRSGFSMSGYNASLP